MFARLEVEQQRARQRIRIALYVGFHAGCLKERMAVVIEVIKLSRDVTRKIICEKNTGRKAISNACFRRSGSRIDGAVPVDPIADSRPDFVLLAKSGTGEKNNGDVLHSGISTFRLATP